MEQDGLIRLRMDPEKEEVLMKYVKDRRYQYMLLVYGSLAFSVLLAVPAIRDIDAAIHGGGSYYAELPDFAELMLARRYRSRRYIPGTLFAEWLLAVLFFLLTFLRGFGTKFGPGSDYHCLVNQRYGFGTMIVGGKQPDNGKHPYCLNDQQGNTYTCPVFLDYKKADLGDEMYCVVLDNGKRFALAGKEKPWWEED